eukprot:CAMPEP_0168457056 /NCGR_PEP_ID=MMETSP0228-20121227/51627_1 /TAXON_ID=133427 /ORGANISM="Protoceratium reticulatum, Strain CCCM 535 (=CCMP 1889)" /LENGTH=248 /DNA_ID=CAMNT_0008472037 /DNA_START=24 /DNA_END=766 /DNA_ORIENTATION=+
MPKFRSHVAICLYAVGNYRGIWLAVGDSQAHQSPDWRQCTAGASINCDMDSAAKDGSEDNSISFDARAVDCSFLEARCLTSLNMSAGMDLVPTEEVMLQVEKHGRDNLHAGGVTGEAWISRFKDAYCQTLGTIKFPASADEFEALQTHIAEQEAESGLHAVLVHADSLDDGVGARFKKAVELVAAALRMGFRSVAMALPPAGSLVQLPGWRWPTWCHESPAEARPDGEPYPLRCWRLDLQGDLLGQTA